MKKPDLFFAFLGIAVTWVAERFPLWADERHGNGDFIGPQRRPSCHPGDGNSQKGKKQIRFLHELFAESLALPAEQDEQENHDSGGPQDRATPKVPTILVESVAREGKEKIRSQICRRGSIHESKPSERVFFVRNEFTNGVHVAGEEVYEVLSEAVGSWVVAGEQEGFDSDGGDALAAREARTILVLGDHSFYIAGVV